MAKIQVIRSVLLVSGVLAVAACATQPRTSLLERKFQQTAQNYQKFEHNGRVVYCRKDAAPQCITEEGLRKQVRDYERNRNVVSYTRSPPG